MNQLTDAQLLAYIDGEAPPDVAREIERSSEYQQRVKQLSQFEGRLQAQLTRAGCPDAFELGEYHFRLLSSQRTAEIRSHLPVCPRCTEELDQLRQFIGFQTAPQLGPVEQIRKIVAQLFSPGSEATGPRSGLAPAFGLRGAMEAPQVYTAGESQIILDFQPEPQSSQAHTLVGLFIGPDPAGRTIEIVSSSGEVLRAEVDELGNFTVSGLKPGEYSLRILSLKEEIHIPNLHVP